MNSSTTALASLLQNIDFKSSLTQSLAVLQQTLQRRSIAATSQIALQAYHHICQQYINLATNRSLPQSHRMPSKPIAVSQLLKAQSSAFPHKEPAVMQIVKKHYLRRFITLLKKGEEAARREEDRARKALRIESAKFHYRLKVARQFMKALRLEQQQTQEMEARAQRFVQSKEQIMLQEYFLGWREEALMSEAERNYRQETEKKYLLLAKLQFLRRFISVRQAKDSQKNMFLQQSQLLRNYLAINIKSILFRSFRNHMRIKNQLNKQQTKIQNLRMRQLFTSFLQTCKRKAIYCETAQAKREALVNKVVYAKLLLRRMRQGVHLRKAYFKNDKKIIFLGMLLEQIKENLSRKGYDHQWMQQLEPNLSFVDRTLNYPLRKHHISRAFSHFKSQLRAERTKIEAIKQKRGGYMLKQLIYNYKLSIIKQKQEHKAEALRIYLIRSSVNRVFSAIQQCYSRSTHLQKLSYHLELTKKKVGFHFFKISSRSSKFYRGLLEAFTLKRQKTQLEIIFGALRRVLLTQRVNNKLVEEYQRYTSRVKIEDIFNCLKDNCFSEKLLRKKQQNAMRIRISRYADQLFYSLKVDLYAQAKQRIAAICIKQTKLQQKIKHTVLNKMARRIRAKRTKEALDLIIDKEYQLRFKWKIFNLLKVIVQRRQHEEALMKTITEKKQRQLKELVLDKMLARLLLALLLKQINGKLQKKLLVSALQILGNKELGLESIYQQEKGEYQANTSAKHTSQIQLGSPTFDLSSDIQAD